MDRKLLKILIWAAVAAQVVLVLAGVVLKALIPASAPIPPGVMMYAGPLRQLINPVYLLLGSLTVLSFPLIGALLLTRRPNLRVGWLFCIINIGWAINNFVSAFALYAFTTRPAWMPLAARLVWAYMWPGFVSVGLMISLMLIFPDGRLLSRRWRGMVWVVGIDVALSVIFSAFARGPIDASLGVPLNNPLGLPGPVGQAFQTITNDSPFPLIELLLLLLACVSLVLRYRSAQGEVRLQLRWLAASMVVVMLLLLSQIVVLTRFPFSPAMPFWAQMLLLLSEMSFALIPVSAGIAILRYHLYDIDRIINRALVYGALTVSLGLVYFGGVILLQLILRAVTGEGRSTLATVLSTLAIAGLFAPLRRRIQQVIDQRFFRRKYDSQRVLADFAAALRSEVDLDRLSEQFLHVVGDTFEPEETQLWLKRTRR